METSTNKEETQDINCLVVKIENHGDSKYLNVNQGKETEIYENISEERNYEVSQSYGEKKDPLEITNEKKQIIVKKEYDNYKSQPFVEILIKTEQLWSPHHVPSELTYTESENDVCDTDSKHHNIEYSRDIKDLHVCGLVGDDIPSTSNCKREKTSLKDLKKSKSLILSEDQQGMEDPECNKLEPVHSAQKADNYIFECPYCFKKICNKHNLKVHIDSVHKNMKYVCTVCQKKFSFAANLRNHMKTVHNQNIKIHKEIKVQKCYECNECHKTFSMIGNLKVHINSVHSKIKDFICEVCGSSFSRLKSLQYHFNSIHQGIKDYECIECFKKFSESSKLKVHINSVHRGIKNYECNECKKRFSLGSTLKSHVRTVHRGNKNFICDHCHSRFSTSGNLRRHVNSLHKGITKFTCEECNKKFTEFKNIKQHINALHARIGNYTCKGCGNKFAWLKQFKRHINLIHHGDTG